MVGASASQIECEAAFRDFAAKQGIAGFEFVEVWGELAMRHKLDEKFEGLFVRGRNNGVGALDALVFVVDTQRGVLTGFEGERAAGIHAKQPQILRQILALEYASCEVSLGGQSHACNHPLLRFLNGGYQGTTRSSSV